MRNRLKVLRAERDWSQAELWQTVNARETGDYDPSVPLAYRIARLFGTSVERVFLDDDETPSS